MPPNRSAEHIPPTVPGAVDPQYRRSMAEEQQQVSAELQRFLLMVGAATEAAGVSLLIEAPPQTLLLPRLAFSITAEHPIVSGGPH